MKGLIIKDINLMTEQSKVIILCGIVAVISAITGVESSQDYSFILMYCPTLFLLTAMSTISYDTFDNGLEYLFTLPVSRKLYVVEKYVLFSICSLVGVIVGLALVFGSIIVKEIDVSCSSIAAFAAGAMAGMIILMSVFIPIEIKFGPEKMRTVLIVAFGVIAMVVILVKKLWPESNEVFSKGIAKIGGMGDIIVGIILLVTVISIFAISMLLSINVMKKKEF